MKRGAPLPRSIYQSGGGRGAGKGAKIPPPKRRGSRRRAAHFPPPLRAAQSWPGSLTEPTLSKRWETPQSEPRRSQAPASRVTSSLRSRLPKLSLAEPRGGHGRHTLNFPADGTGAIRAAHALPAASATRAARDSARAGFAYALLASAGLACASARGARCHGPSSPERHVPAARPSATAGSPPRLRCHRAPTRPGQLRPRFPEYLRVPPGPRQPRPSRAVKPPEPAS